MSSFDVPLPRALSSPTLARRHTMAFLHENHQPNVASDAGLVVSELVSNAVMHGSDPIRLAVDIDAMLRIEVFDGNTEVERVAVRHLEPGSPGGRGLQIVSALADTWGTVQHREGKVVWARLRLPGRRVEVDLTEARSEPWDVITRRWRREPSAYR